MNLYHTEISNESIGMKIRHRRIQLGWTAHSLGKKSGLSQQQISRYECGTQNFTINRLCIFANILQCDLSYFLVNENEPIEVVFNDNIY